MINSQLMATRRSLVFGIFPDKTAMISGLTIRNGSVWDLNEGTLTVSNCAVTVERRGLRRRNF